MRFLLLTLLAALLARTPVLAGPRVVADIPPIHALAAAVMQGVASPDLLFPPGASPHGAGFRPHQARALARAGIVFWIGPELTPRLGTQIATLAPGAASVRLIETPGLTLRQPAIASAPGRDPHIWLDPDNALLVVEAIAMRLAAADPAGAAQYRDNARQIRARIQAARVAAEATLAPLGERAFLTYHDAFGYFADRFGLSQAGSVTAGEAHRPGAARLSVLRRRIVAENIVCVFAEPQFPDRIMNVLTEGTEAKRATLDPLGAGLETGPALYPALIRALAADMAACLAP